MSPVPDANADQTQSGSRLKAQYYVGTDGSKQFAGSWQDTGRTNETCSFLSAGDGVTRCLPNSGAQTTYGSVGGYFGDAGCTTPLAFAACGASPAYALGLETVTTTCPASYRYHLYQGGAVYSGAIYERTSTACQEVAEAGVKLGAITFFTMGAEIDPSSFVQAQLMAE